MLRSLWSYRHFIRASILGDLRGRFARSALGGLWFVIHPLAQAMIFAFVLSSVMAAKLPGVAGKASYPIYLLAGTAAWTLFSEILSRSISVFIENASTLKKIAFPRLCLPVIVWGNALINHVLLIWAIGVVFVAFGHFPHHTWIALPIGAIIISMLAFGIGVMGGVFNVFSRDVGQVTTVATNVWFWMTPIVYPVDALPPAARVVTKLNPMTPLVQFYQDILLLHQWPDFSSLAYPFLLAVALVALSIFVFRRASPEMVDAL